MKERLPYIIAITGASGAIYAQTLLRWLAIKNYPFFLLLSESAKKILKSELGLELTATDPQALLKEKLLAQPRYPGLQYVEANDLGHSIASGSFPVAAMVVIPCSMGVMSRIAHGISTNLIERAADVTIKEKRPLIVVPRETPLSLIHLKNMLILKENGVDIIPAMPAFYQQPHTIEDLTKFVAGKVLEALHLQHTLYQHWKSP